MSAYIIHCLVLYVWVFCKYCYSARNLPRPHYISKPYHIVVFPLFIMFVCTLYSCTLVYNAHLFSLIYIPRVSIYYNLFTHFPNDGNLDFLNNSSLHIVGHFLITHVKFLEYIHSSELLDSWIWKCKKLWNYFPKWFFNLHLS